MTQETLNKISASFYRFNFLLKMLDTEAKYMSQFSVQSGIKNILYRGKRNYYNMSLDLIPHLPNSAEKVSDIMKTSEEKIAAIQNIIEKLSVLDEETVLEIEEQFEKLVKVQY